MATYKRFEELAVWQAARVLTRQMYAACAAKPFTDDRDLRNQIRRASVSVMANIAERFERDGRREFVQFLSVAGGSLGELRSHLYVALDAGYVAVDEFERLQAAALAVGRQLGGLRYYLQESFVEGSKFRRPGTRCPTGVNQKPETRNQEPETRVGRVASTRPLSSSASGAACRTRTPGTTTRR